MIQPNNKIDILIEYMLLLAKLNEIRDKRFTYLNKNFEKRNLIDFSEYDDKIKEIRKRIKKINKKLK